MNSHNLTRLQSTPARRKILPGLLTCFIVVSMLLTGCKDDPELPEFSDAQLYELAKQTANFTWYKHSDNLLHGTSGSEHGMPYYRTRFNETAATMLNEDGLIKEGAEFPEGSVIVKELFDETETFGVYSLRYKAAGYSNTDSKGYIWGLLAADGTVMEPTANKGTMCIACHARAGNIDYTLLNSVTK